MRQAAFRRLEFHYTDRQVTQHLLVKEVMPKATQYQSRQSDDNGIIHWSDEENQIWSELYARQIPLVKERACQ